MSAAPEPQGGAQPQENAHQRLDDALASDADMAAAVAGAMASGYCWAGGLGWRRYDGQSGTWAAVPEEVAAERVRVLILEAVAMHLAAASQLAGENQPKSADYELRQAAAWRKYASAGRIFAITRLARGILLTDPSLFDTHPHLLNTPDGVLDLRTLAMGPHDPALLLTRVTRARYVPGAVHPDWAMALEAIPADVRDYIQLRYGQGTTGHAPPDDVMLVQIGTGENGKTTVTAGIRSALGLGGNAGNGYVASLSERVLTADPKDHPTEIMDLLGARIGLLEETPEDHRLRTTRLKLLTGDTITARLVRQNTVTWANTCSVQVMTNYLPIVTETDHGTWRRLLALVYPYRFRKPHEELKGPADRRGAPGLRERVRAGGDGIGEAVLAWLVEGAARWYAGEPAAEPGAWRREPMGMGEPPARIVADTAEWRSRCDRIWTYVRERLVFDRARYVMSADLLDDVNLWMGTRYGQGRPWSPELLASRFGSHSIFTENEVRKGRARRTDSGLSRPPGLEAAPGSARFQAWFGVRFRTAADDMADGVSADQTASGAAGTTDIVNSIRGIETSGQRSVLSQLSQDHSQPDIPAQISGQIPDINGLPHYDFAVLHQMADRSAGEAG